MRSRISLSSSMLLSTLALAASSVGCSNGDDNAAREPDQVKSELARDTAPSATSAEVAALTSANTDFAFDFYRTSAPKLAGQNLFFSPHSISAALAMTFAGARGTTAQEMTKALHFAQAPETLHSAMNAVDLALSSRGQGEKGADGEPFRLRVVNSNWANTGTPFEKPFLDTLARNYGAGMYVTDFEREPEPSRTLINQWTSRQTENRINDLIPKGEISTNTRMVLVNAVYFNAEWFAKFDANLTAKQDFTRADGTNQRADMMTRQTDFTYAETDSYQAVNLLYAGGETSMVVVLPKEGRWATFESEFDGSIYRNITSSLAPATVKVSLPKFKIAGESMSLKETLSNLGMPTPFTGNADFSGILDPSVYPLMLKDVLHKAFVNVDEVGTEAAAATAVIVDKVSAPREVKVFNANRPFFFFIRDIPTGALLFFGRMTDPQR
ncbi:serpin family protein [Pendulispora rubella]|uniref:Serpin family protein n=1 Tax=Pendulispora rubella TaxID=2741070 RepID=A0ABZ2LDX7_9BACT